MTQHPSLPAQPVPRGAPSSSRRMLAALVLGLGAWGGVALLRAERGPLDIEIRVPPEQEARVVDLEIRSPGGEVIRSAALALAPGVGRLNHSVELRHGRYRVRAFARGGVATRWAEAEGDVQGTLVALELGGAPGGNRP